VPPGEIAGLLIILVLRPLAGFVSLARMASPPGERAARATSRRLPPSWAVAAFVILLSVVLHGVTAFPVMRRLDDSHAARGRG